MVQNLTWSELYLRIDFPNYLIQKVLTLVPLTETGPEVYVTTITTNVSNSYDALEDILEQLKILKLNIYSVDNVTY